MDVEQHERKSKHLQREQWSQALRGCIETVDFLSVLIKNQLRVDAASVIHKIDPIWLLVWWFSQDVFLPIKRKIPRSQNLMVKNQGKRWMQTVWRGYLHYKLFSDFCHLFPVTTEAEENKKVLFHLPITQRVDTGPFPPLSNTPPPLWTATWNELTWTFPHTSGSEAVFSIRVDIHLIGGGVIQDQWGTRILARSFIPKLAACLSLNNIKLPPP